jgi:ADP-ribose pyrophosphatase YjhB (NUDIX family)
VTALIRQEGRPSNNAQYTSAGEGSVLLTRRINEPFKGKWTLPGGFVDAFEDPSEAIRRECLEETGLTIAVNRLRELLSGREHANGSDILIVYDARIIGGELKPGDDADRAEFFPLHSLPELAFQSTAKILHEIS